MILTSAFSKENSDASLEEFNMFTTATRKLRVNDNNKDDNDDDDDNNNGNNKYRHRNCSG